MRRISVRLRPWEESYLREKISSGVSPAREILRARALLGSHDGVSVEKMEEAGISSTLGRRVRLAYAQGGLSKAIRRSPQPPRPEKRKLTDETEARLVALVCSEAPEGRSRWTLRLLADRAVDLLGESLSHESVRRALKKTNSNLGASSVG